MLVPSKATVIVQSKLNPTIRLELFPSSTRTALGVAKNASRDLKIALGLKSGRVWPRYVKAFKESTLHTVNDVSVYITYEHDIA